MSVYETKTVRIHLPEKGRYVYLLLTRFDGEGHILADEGWRSEYIRYGIISRNVETEGAVTGDPFAFVRQNDWLRETAAAAFMKDLEMGRIDWDDFEDEDKLSPSEIDSLAGREEVEA